jgi:CheY-like chemotaxis protein
LLLVDDSPTILKMTSLMLMRLGYHVDKRTMAKSHCK